ncbi:TetR/AcrR family transcriptional regulator, partial [Crossiella equi]
MAAGTTRPLRADAARNLERIIGAARDLFREGRFDASLEEIAARAKVSPATLYRRFASRVELLSAVMMAHSTPALRAAAERARQVEDPVEAMLVMLEESLRVAVIERRLLCAADVAGALTFDLEGPLYAPLAEFLRRAQAEGRIRADLDAEDLPPLVMMLIGSLSPLEKHGGHWRRYLRLALDGMAPAAATPLPPRYPVQVPPNG